MEDEGGEQYDDYEGGDDQQGNEEEQYDEEGGEEGDEQYDENEGQDGEEEEGEEEGADDEEGEGEAEEQKSKAGGASSGRGGVKHSKFTQDPHHSKTMSHFHDIACKYRLSTPGSESLKDV